LVFICDPNNPTGNRVGAAAIVEALTRANPETYVAVDEAYWEFNLGEAGEAAMTVAGLIAHYPSLIVLRTMSKAFALAGARLGFALAGRETAARLEVVRMAFNVNSLSMAVAEVVLNEADYVRDVVARVIDGRRRLTAGLAGIAGLSPLPSWTNFVLVGTVRPAAEVAKALADRGVRVRLFPDVRLSNHFRISVGRPEELDQCLEALSDVMEGDS
ncbi:MAG TPA: aminotransferase class I/II-fold pyridoxal phosphate-dependent enzyme, partial [Bacillota bacterium]